MTDVLAVWETPAVEYPASEEDSVVVRASLELSSTRDWCAKHYEPHASCWKQFSASAVVECGALWRPAEVGDGNIDPPLLQIGDPRGHCDWFELKLNANDLATALQKSTS